MKKLHPDKFISFLIKYFYIFMMTLILIICVFFSNIEYSCNNKWYLSGEGNYPYLYLLFGVIILFLLQFVCSKLFLWIDDKKILVASVIFLIIQIYIIYNYYFYPGWDASALRLSAITLATSGDFSEFVEHYSLIPNNLFLFLTYYNIFRVFGVFNISTKVAYFFIICIQCILYNVSSILLYKILKKITNKKIYPVFGWFIYNLYIGLSPWLSIAYSDGASLVFPILFLYLFWIYDVKGKREIIKYFVLGIIIYAGYKIKAQTIIVVIASAIVLLFRKIEIKNLTTLIGKKLLPMIFGILSVLIIFNIQLSSLNLGLNNEMNLGSSHYIMMGLNNETNGVYSADDVKISGSVETKAARNKLNYEIVKQRIEEYGLSGLANLWHRKLLTNYNDGTFSWGTEGTFIKEKLSEEGKPLSRLLRSLYYIDYEGEPLYTFFSINQLLWYGILVLSIFSFIKSKRDNNIISVIKLSIIGLTLFVMLFEARARYLFIYSPFFIILAIIGINNIQNKLTK